MLVVFFAPCPTYSVKSYKTEDPIYVYIFVYIGVIVSLRVSGFD
jgi:hypothetical protein